MMVRVLASCLLGLLLMMALLISASAQAARPLTLLNQAGEPVQRLTDGDLVRLALQMPQAVQEAMTVTFYLDEEANHIGDCQIPAGRQSCTTPPTGALGWYWDNAQQVKPERTIYATVQRRLITFLTVTVQPRPVVMVHGFGASYTTWDAYLGPSGYLARMGLQGYAVGDGQVTGTMHTGNLLKPRIKTNTIAQNAAILAEYIANVKAETGAEQVDLIGHSMGGLIARYYIDRIMEQRDVAQLIMLGTPNGGSDCAILAGSLNLYQPAALELRSSYVRNVFNPQITERREVPFYIFAGTPIQRRLLSPCSATPNDLVVSLASAAAIPAELVEVPILHTELNTSESLFADYVAPLLRKPGSEFTNRGEQISPALSADEDLVQFSRIYTGVVTSEEGNEHVIHIDNDVAVASFGLYDPSRSLTVTVRGASGNVIVLEPDTHGLTIIDDPASLLYLGYGFENPRPGPWRVTVRPTKRTPPLGTEYAIIAHYVGGAAIEARLSNQLPGVGEQVELTATLQLGEEALPLDSAQVILHRPDGWSELIQASANAFGIAATFAPEEPGIYGVDVTLSSDLPDGAVVERTTFLAFEAFTAPPARRE
ncbi:MAG TPA: alpha/beta fold hydrolase [Caldilineaceae bacterium]|nr:alpha/beta fold hydrolase [Caldilineaceae bacterium]